MLETCFSAGPMTISSLPFIGTLYIPNFSVVKPTRKTEDESEGFPPRYSMAYFCNPNFNSMIKTLDCCVGGEMGSVDRYPEAISSSEHLVERLNSTISY
jgi:hypothetical protein